jgi:hypothetical protein
MRLIAHRVPPKIFPAKFGSSRQASPIVQQIAMIGGSEWFLQALRAVLANLHEAIGQAGPLFATDAIEALANSCGHRRRHRLTRPVRKLFRQATRFRVLDIQSH